MRDIFDDPIEQQVRTVLTATASGLAARGAPDEPLAEFTRPKRILFIARQSRMLPIGRVWRLGVLLLTTDARLYAAGSTTRAVPPGWPNYQSISGEQRREYRAAALKGGYTDGEVVNFDAVPIDLRAESLRDGCGRLFVHDTQALVRWNATADSATSVPLDLYLREQAALLIEPPLGT